jgi:hypothetical protein
MKNLQTFSQFVNEAKTNDTEPLKSFLSNVEQEMVDYDEVPAAKAKKYASDLRSAIEKALGAKENKIVVDFGNYDVDYSDLTKVATFDGKKYDAGFDYSVLEKDGKDGYLWLTQYDTQRSDALCIRLK